MHIPLLVSNFLEHDMVYTYSETLNHLSLGEDALISIFRNERNSAWYEHSVMYTFRKFEKTLFEMNTQLYTYPVTLELLFFH